MTSSVQQERQVSAAVILSLCSQRGLLIHPTSFSQLVAFSGCLPEDSHE